jgi:hypothetical protein
MTVQERAFAQQSTLQVNRYSLTDGERMRVVFFPEASHMRSPGTARFDYQDSQGEFIFIGDAIHQQNSRFGLLVSVQLQLNSEPGQSYFTLVLPTVNLAGAKKRAFETIAIETRTLSNQRDRATADLKNIKKLDFLLDRAGAEVFYKVLKLKGFAESDFETYNNTFVNPQLRN